MLIKSKRYPEADTYSGYIHHSTIEDTVARFPGLDTIASKIISEAVESEISKSGGRLLEVAVYSKNSWWGIIPTYIITTEIKWYLPGEISRELSLGDAKLAVQAIIIAVVVAIAAIYIMWKIAHIFDRHYDVVEKYGYAPWYSSMFGSLTLLIIAGAGAYLIIRYGPSLYKKIYKEKKT